MELNLSKQKQEIFIKTIIWNIIIDIFKVEKNIDITQYLVSIKIKWNIIIIKTNKPIINTELLILNTKIKKSFKEKFWMIKININDFEFKYI